MEQLRKGSEGSDDGSEVNRFTNSRCFSRHFFSHISARTEVFSRT
jgi:hypothetical protein